MKKIILNVTKLLEVFDFKTAKIAENVVSACDPIEDSEDAQDAILSAIDNQLVYYADQWQIISAYSSPAEPMNFAEASLLFEEDIMNCIEEVNADAGKYRLVSYAVRRRSDRMTWDAWKAEVRAEGGYDGDRFDYGIFDSVEEAEKSACDDWSSLEKVDQYTSCYDIEKIGEDLDGNEDEVIKSFDFWQDMLKAENEKADEGEENEND